MNSWRGIDGSGKRCDTESVRLYHIYRASSFGLYSSLFPLAIEKESNS